jgi:hypothetical protein
VWVATDPLPQPWIPTPDEFHAAAQETLGLTQVRPAPTLIG